MKQLMWLVVFGFSSSVVSAQTPAGAERKPVRVISRVVGCSVQDSGGESTQTIKLACRQSNSEKQNPFEVPMTSSFDTLRDKKIKPQDVCELIGVGLAARDRVDIECPAERDLVEWWEGPGRRVYCRENVVKYLDTRHAAMAKELGCDMADPAPSPNAPQAPAPAKTVGKKTPAVL